MQDHAMVPRKSPWRAAGRQSMRGWRIGCRGKTPAEDGALLVPDGLLPQVPTGHAGTGPGRGDDRAPGYHKRDPAGRGGSNDRNGSTPRRC
jgi:hypothetical protein